MTSKEQNREVVSSLRATVSEINMVFESMIIHDRVNMASLNNAKKYIQDAQDHANGEYSYE